MLDRLTIQDFVLINKLSLGLSAGLNIFTGETGAGKSILLDALGLTLGAKADASLVRSGAAQAIVTAEFSGATPLLNTLATEHGLTLEDPVILRRTLTADGKSRAFLNDQPISLNLLRQAGNLLLEIHGQFETQGLLNTATHRALLDDAAQLHPNLAETAAAHATWRHAETAYSNARENQARAAAEEEFLRAAVAELDMLSPEAGETEKLAERRTTLQHHEKIMDTLQAAEQNINGGRGVIAGLTQAGKALAKIIDKAPHLEPLLNAIDRATAEAHEAANLLSRTMAAEDNQPETLQHIEERLFALRALARKHNILPEALPELKNSLTEKYLLLVDTGDKINALKNAAAQTRKKYSDLSEQLSERRKKFAQELAQQIMAELPPLKLDRAQFFIDVEDLPEDQWNATGKNRVTFLIAPNPGTPAGPLNKIASGGELSRLMLALKVVLAASNPVSALVFDEIDQGIGGATASAVGTRLKKLSQNVQVLVVTHSPQIAAGADHHLKVEKKTSQQQTNTFVTSLNAGERLDEIARMLSGAAVTEAAKAAASSLMSAISQTNGTDLNRTGLKATKSKTERASPSAPKLAHPPSPKSFSNARETQNSAALPCAATQSGNNKSKKNKTTQGKVETI